MLDAEMGTAPTTDQAGSTVRLPIGQGVGPHELISSQQGSAGTFCARSESWEGIVSPPAATDSRPGRFTRVSGGNRMHPAPAQDARVVGSFEERFPHAARVEVWGGR